jgi:hypothetical protein
MALPKWTGFQEKTLWDWLDLLLVPLILGIGIATIETMESRRVDYNLTERYKQEMLRDYFRNIHALVFNKQNMTTLKNAERYDPQRELLGSQTLTTLEVLEEDTTRKSQIIRFIGNSSLSRFIPLRRANLADTNLSHVDLTGADLRLTNLKRANLTGANLCRADLSGAKIQQADLTDAKYNNETVMPEELSESQLQSMDKWNSSSCHSSPDQNQKVPDSPPQPDATRPRATE